MYIDFETWLNRVLEENMPIDGAAVNFNLYEETDHHWSIQLIVSSYFDEGDPDWCCDETFTTGEDLFRWKQEVEWDEILDIAINLIHKYLDEGKFADTLKHYEAVATGFVDGDVEILYKR